MPPGVIFMTPPIGLAFIIDEVGRATAGTENQVLHMIQRLDPRLFRVHLIVLRPSPSLDPRRIPCPVKPLHVRRLLSLHGVRALFTLRSWLRANHISVVQTFFKDANVLGLLAAALAGVALRLSSRRSLPYEASGRDKLVYRIMDPFIHYYVVNGAGVRDHLIHMEGVAPERIRVFHNLVDPRIEAARDERDRRSGGERIVFLMVANLRPVKGHPFLIEAVARVRTRIPHARFVLVGGQSPADPDVHELVVKAGLAERFVFEGLQSEVRRFLDAADVGLLCSSSEGFSSTLLEYIAVGLPCIATDVGSNKEIVLQGKNGFLVPYGDSKALGEALVTLYDDVAMRREMGRRSRAHFEEKFLSTAQTEKLERFYCEEVAARTAG